MKRVVVFVLCVVVCLDFFAQPTPYPIDQTFVPELSFLQEEWNGEYNGIDPRSGTRLYISRTLCLNDDMTFTNVTYGGIIQDDICADTLLFKSEKGIYEYNADLRQITYVVQGDSSLALDVYLKAGHEVEYTVNDNVEGTAVSSYQEKVQFMSEHNGTRSWVVQDTKLGSDQMQGKPAVYLMEVVLRANSIITIGSTSDLNGNNHQMYDLMGRKISHGTKSDGIVIMNGRKYLFRK